MQPLGRSSVSASSHVMRSNRPSPLAPTRFIGCEQPATVAANSSNGLTLTHRPPRVCGWSALPRSFTAVPSSSTVITQLHASGQSSGQAPTTSRDMTASYGRTTVSPWRLRAVDGSVMDLSSSLLEPLSDDELTALALAADPDRRSTTTRCRSPQYQGEFGDLLPAWYMPAPVGERVEATQRSGRVGGDLLAALHQRTRPVHHLRPARSALLSGSYRVLTPDYCGV